MFLLLILVLEPPFDPPSLVSRGDCISSDTPTRPGAWPSLALGRVGMRFASVVGVVGSVVAAADSSLGSVRLAGPGEYP